MRSQMPLINPIRTLLFILSTFLLTGITYADNREQAETLYEQAQNKLFDNEDSVDKETVFSAIELYKKAIIADSSFAPAYEQLAIEYWSLGETQAAYKTLQIGISSVSDDTAMFILLRGIFEEDQGNIELANQSYKKSIELFDTVVKEKKSFDTIFFRALAYYLTQDVDVAIEKYKEAVNLGYFSDGDFEVYYDMQLELLENIDLTEYLEQSITNKYHFK